MTASNYVCLHGHFYQPPRENPFTGEIQDQPSAAPFRNWNERITSECYGPNLSAPVLGDDGVELARTNNYGWISFDFGPTLLDWLEDHAPDTYRGIIDSDSNSASHFGGHGSAMAHAYNHSILPLANPRDKRTQIRWGIADFVHRFGRRPKGMWLPETAVDGETLEILIDQGIEFTVLSPHQAESVYGDDGDWKDVANGRVDTRIPYRVEPVPGKSIAVFFYDGPLSQEIAFNGLLEDGRILAKRLADTLGKPPKSPSLAHVATDGETYGHHHRFGELALASAIEEWRADAGVAITNYGQFLALYPPTRLARVEAQSSWSCAHGVERWRSDCGCSTGSHPGWSQSWRAPLRKALDGLRDSLIPDFESARGRLLIDPWAARDAYIEVLLGRATPDFIAEHGLPDLGPAEVRTALGLLQIQHLAMLMYTSCGWFFDDIAGLESVFVLRHAGKAIEMAREVTGRDLEPAFLAHLDRANSNVGGMNGRDIYLAEVAPYMSRES